MDQLQTALAELELARVQLAQAQREHQIAERRYALLAELLGQPAACGSDYLVEQVIAILQEQGPQRLGELKQKLLLAGVPIPGKGTDANLVGYINRCGRIKRCQRGVYGLP